MMMKKWLKQTKNEKGLTLVELLAVVVILGIIAAIAVPSIGNIIENSKKDAAISNAQQVLNASRLYSAAGGDINGTDGYDKSSGISEYHESIVDPWDSDEDDLDYNVVFSEEGTPDITITYSKCGIANKTAQDLSTLDRDNACEDSLAVQ